MAIRKTLAEMEQSAADTEARKNLISLFDEDTFVELDKFVTSDGDTVGTITGYGSIDGAAVYAFAQDVTVKGGAVCKASAAKLKKLYELAVRNGSPVVGIFDSKGGDVSEGVELLGAYGDIISASAQLSGVVPQISVVTGICAGASASLCCMADFVVMTKDAELFLNAPFISEDAKLAGAGTAANAAKAGVASIIADDAAAAIAQAKKLIRILPQNNLELAGNDYFAENDADVTASLKGIAMMNAIADKDSVIELASEFGTSAAVALASVNWTTVGFVCTNKADAKLTQADCAKIARFVSICDSFSIPVVTIIDTEGFAPSCAAELAGSVRDTARLAQVYAGATTAKIALITGSAIGSAYISLGSAASNDVVLAYESAVISPITPNAAAVFLHDTELKDKSISELADEYKATEASPFGAAAYGYVNRIIDPADTRAAIISSIDITSRKRVASPSRKHINFVF